MIALLLHYTYVIMNAMASQITSLTIVYSTVYSGADQRKHQKSVSLAFVRGICRSPVNSPHKRPVTRKMFPFDDVIMPIHVKSPRIIRADTSHKSLINIKHAKTKPNTTKPRGNCIDYIVHLPLLTRPLILMSLRNPKSKLRVISAQICKKNIPMKNCIHFRKFSLWYLHDLSNHLTRIRKLTLIHLMPHSKVHRTQPWVSVAKHQSASD